MLYLPKSVKQLAPSFALESGIEKVYFFGEPPKGFTEGTGGVTAKSVPSSATLYYIEGTPGWTSPTWTGADGTVYKTETFKP